jgi:RNA polymerase sigma factor FliA
MNEMQQQAPTPVVPLVQDAEAYIPFVRKIAGRIARRLPESVDLDDLVSAGTIGLMEAMNRYDPSGGRDFKVYAEYRVKGAILDELRRADPLNRAARYTQNKVLNKTAQLTNEFGRPPEVEEVAAALRTSVSDYVSKISPMQTLRVVSMDTDAMQSGVVVNQEDLVAKKQTMVLVRKALESLSERNQMVLNMYYVDQLTQSQIGEVLGVSESRICQILSESLKRVRRQVKGQMR